MFFDRFKRSAKIYALVIEDAGTYMHFENYEKDNELILDKYFGNAFVCPASVKPIRIKIGKKIQYCYLIWKDAGVAVNIGGEVPGNKNLRQLDTDPDEACDVLDVKSVQQVIAKNPAGYRLWFFFLLGLVVGTFILARFL